MRPDRIVVGEVRGAEAVDMLAAMNTGHDGSLTTIHANTPRDALSRVENMVSMTGISFPTKSLREQIASAIDLVIQIARHEDVITSYSIHYTKLYDRGYRRQECQLPPGERPDPRSPAAP